MKRIAFILVAAALTCSAPAQAASPRLTESLRIAEGFWGATPAACPTGISVRAIALDGEIGGFTSEGEPCRIWLDAAMLRDRTWRAKVQTCNTIVHEYGHLLGVEHSERERSIMYPTSDVTVRACHRRFAPRLARGLHRSRVTWATR